MRDKVKYKEKTLMYQYFISYICILIIPIIILVISFKYRGFKILEREILKKDIITLKAATYNLERVLDTCRNIVIQITSIYKPFKLNSDVISATSLIKTLRKYISTNNMYKEIFVIFNEYEYSYTSTSSIKTADFYKKYTPDNLTYEEYRSKLQNIKGPTLIRNILDQDKYYTFYIFPYFYREEIIGNIIFKIDNEDLDDLLGIDSNEIKREDYLVTKQELEIYYDKISEYLQLGLETQEIKNDVKKLLKKNSLKNDKTYIIRSLQRKNLFISYIPKCNIVYISVASNDQIFYNLKINKIIMFSIIIMVVILGISFVVWITRYSYRPIQQLQYLIQPYRIKFNQQEYENELDLIKETLKYLSKQNEQLAYEIEKNTQIKQKYLLNQLINGIIGNKEVFYQECIDIGIKLIAQYHSIVIVQKNKEVVSELEILSFIQNYMKDKGEINYAHIVQILKDNIFVLLIGVNEKKNLTQHLFKKHNFKIAIGTIESDVYCIPNAYIRARSFFELSEAEESNILAWDQIEEYIGATRC